MHAGVQARAHTHTNKKATQIVINVAHLHTHTRETGGYSKMPQSRVKIQPRQMSY